MPHPTLTVVLAVPPVSLSSFRMLNTKHGHELHHRWEFLTPVQKTGSPLPREAIARRCARDFGLLRFLCVSARSSAARAASSCAADPSVSAATAAGRAKLFSFYAAVVVEALASLGSASEPLLRALVPTVVHGLSATSSPEYQVRGWQR